jgi:hypothetical protein
MLFVSYLYLLKLEWTINIRSWSCLIISRAGLRHVKCELILKMWMVGGHQFYDICGYPQIFLSLRGRGCLWQFLTLKSLPSRVFLTASLQEAQIPPIRCEFWFDNKWCEKTCQVLGIHLLTGYCRNVGLVGKCGSSFVAHSRGDVVLSLAAIAAPLSD